MVTVALMAALAVGTPPRTDDVFATPDFAASPTGRRAAAIRARAEARAHACAGRHLAAAEAYDRAHAAWPSPATLLAAVDAYLDAKAYDRASDAYRRYLKTGFRSTPPRSDPPPAPRPRLVPPEPPGDQFSPMPRRKLKIAAAATLGATALSATALAVMGGATLRARRQFNDAYCGSQCGNGDRYPEDEQRRFSNYRTATNALIGVTAVLAAASTTLAILAWAPQRRRRAASRR